MPVQRLGDNRRVVFVQKMCQEIHYALQHSTLSVVFPVCAACEWCTFKSWKEIPDKVMNVHWTPDLWGLLGGWYLNVSEGVCMETWWWFVVVVFFVFLSGWWWYILYNMFSNFISAVLPLTNGKMLNVLCFELLSSGFGLL